MELTKQRLEAFTDGVVSIIITIMVLSIPLPKSFASIELWGFIRAILIYFLSFIVVSASWIMYHLALSNIEISRRVIISNFMFLFSLSLMPVLTKWVIENPGMLLPAIGYNVVYILVLICLKLLLYYGGIKWYKICISLLSGSILSWRNIKIWTIMVVAVFGSLITFFVIFPKIFIVSFGSIPLLLSFFILCYAVGVNRTKYYPPRISVLKFSLPRA